MLQTVKSEPCRSSFLASRKHTSSVRCVILLCFLHLTEWTVDRKRTSIRPASRRAKRVALLGGQLCDKTTEKAALSCNMLWSQRPYEVVMSFTRSKPEPKL
ncbi:S-adenosylmethionine:tRNAribosyltransferase-isomerase [Striga asiatica]|uniref:S-adenosylmethionine:tRNAribosyltransferase-isomerase n=1 Tax=Striga asiatica TaxID=4170 RepID=A0A5A7Q2E0_STRAF|nr:S-adenosylmethionine:tRNAribosyltransferase-isomerase [Striga asiatica]